MLDQEQIKKIENSSVTDAIRLVTELFPHETVFSSSLGQEDQVLTDIVFKNNLPVKIFTIDTGRLFNETYELLDRTTARYDKSLGVYFPESNDVEEFVASKGINSFYESVENRKECCHIRKVKPLNR